MLQSSEAALAHTAWLLQSLSLPVNVKSTGAQHTAGKMKHLRSDFKQAAKMSEEMRRRETREFHFSKAFVSGWDS